MASSFPTSLDSYSTTIAGGTDYLDTVPHDAQHDNANDAINKLEAKVGVDSSAVTTTIDYKIRNLPASATTTGVFAAGRVAPDVLTTRGDMLTQNPTGTYVRTAIGGANTVWHSNGTDPSWQALVAADIPVLDTSKITTGVFTAARVAPDVLTTRGDLLTQNPTGTYVRKAVGGAATYLRSDGTDPQWALGTANDDFTQYLKLTGRAGGQVAQGGTAASETLDLESTTHATKGLVRVVSGSGLSLWPTNLTVSGLPLDHVKVGATYTLNFPSASAPAGYNYAPTLVLQQSANSAGFLSLFSNTAAIKNTTSTAINFRATNSFFDTPAYTADTAACTGLIVNSFTSDPSFAVISTGTLAVPTVRQFWAAFDGVGAGVTVTDRFGLRVDDAVGSGTLTNQTGVYIANLTKGGTLNIPVRSLGGNSRHVGSWVVGADAAPTNASCGLEVQSATLALKLSTMTTTQRNALTGVDGMVIYNSTTLAVEARVNGVWVTL